MLSLAVLLVLSAAGEEARDLFYRSWQTADGLPDNSVTSVVQTGDDYLWVVTGAGLTRFNGSVLTGISLRNFENVRSRSVRAMFVGRQGQLWLGMERGPLIRIGRAGSHVFTAAEGLFEGEPQSIADDDAGAVWVAYPQGFCRVVDDKVERFDAAGGLPAGGHSWLGKGRAGQLWFARGGKVGDFHEGKFRTLLALDAPRIAAAVGRDGALRLVAGERILTFQDGHDPVEIGRMPAGAEARVALEDRAGVLWIGTANDGLFRLTDKGLEMAPTSHRDIECLSQDREGNLWVGTNGGGLNLVRQRAVTLLGRNFGLPFDSVVSVSEDAAGAVWAVGQSGAVARRQADGWQAAPDTGGSANCVAADAAGGVWLGTRDRGARLLRDGEWTGVGPPEGLPASAVRSLLVAKNGDVWIAMDAPGGLFRWRDGRLTPFPAAGETGEIPAMTESPDGTIWIGTSEGRVLRVGETAMEEDLAIPQNASMPVRALQSSADGSLWIGYGGDGLGWYRDGAYARITSAEGLMDDYISQLQPDGAGQLWIAANRGISQVGLTDLIAVAEGRSAWVSSRVYGRGEGLPALQPNHDHSPTTCLGRDGRVWFSMRTGLAVAEPEAVRDHPQAPLVQIERVTLDDKAVALYGNRALLQREGKGRVLDLSKADPLLRIPPGHNKLRFDFTALSFTSPENVRFRYRLENFDRGWIDADTQRGATYQQLPAGRYVFRVIARNDAGVWSGGGAQLAVVVAPFFWETWWFRTAAALAAVLAAGGLVYLGQRRRYRRKLAKIAARRAIEEERARIARDIHDDLGASLTRILLLSRPRAAAGAAISATGDAPVLGQIHDTSRELIRSMSAVVWAVNPEQDTLDGLADYLGNHAQEFLGLAGIRCRLETPLKLPPTAVSAQIRHNVLLAFKEALNNAVKYSAATEVRIALIPEPPGLVLRVEDNGRGIGDAVGGGNGLANMHRRLGEIGGTCEVASDSRGTHVTFRIPLPPDP